MGRRTLLSGLVAGALLMTACGAGNSEDVAGDGPPATAEPEVIEFNYGVPTAAYLPLYVAQDKGYFEDAGLKPNFFSFQSGAPLLAALKSGSLDVVTTGVATVFALGQGIPLKYVVWEGDASASEGLVARKDSGVESLDDLAGAKLAAPTGTCAQVSLWFAAEKAGLDYADLDVQNIAPNLYANAFSSGSIDAGVAWSPYAVDLEQQGHTVIGWDEDWVPSSGACPEMVAATPEILEKHPDLARRLIEVHDRAYQAIVDDPQVAYDALAERLSISPEVSKGVVDKYLADFPTIEDQLDPESRYSFVGDEGLVAQLTLVSDTFAELGIIPQPVPADVIRDAVDPSYLEDYVAQRE